MEAVQDVQSSPVNVQLEAYTSLIRQAKNADDLKQITAQILETSTSIPLVVARPVINTLIDRISDSEDLLQYALNIITPRISTFEEQVSRIREALASRFEAQQDFLEAARVLQGISLESGQRVITDEYRLRIFTRIIRCLLEEDEAISADTYLNRATLLIHNTSDPEILLHFKLAQARIFDAKRKFIEASQKYHELSFTTQIPDAERLACLEAAITCGVLAPAGPARSRLLGVLYKDERAQGLDNYSILEKMFLDRLIRAQEVDVFAKSLRPHQLALLGDGTTVLSRAVIEHNLLSASRLYENVGVNELGELLGLDAPSAERFARGMIESQRLSGEIDQVSGTVEFTTPTKDAGEGTETERWDRAIQSLLSEVEDCATQIEKKFPEWHAARSTAIV
ncbi:putative COP9 signalosome subunit 4 [Taphrina deformans PYCC 5710]|uniref:COP9 signalosome complex subunit 4 n=1 Tax=Taphrina deformans (strain PYCC 5710 / ATCC 11124 / CBS 356.35 / IMI 108563 / JCM 9778 / NBRC 8474) TaxID=1097556 RepID=R4X8A9_TAPDE|nr:putative COP9 signalosome subunit 4 [Taphrina deformans PYCC 5710]|eukprot:CCG81507.1 putative COP9 signalosome subunit 4 [Taphrina deformans PYCC 5710]